VWGHDGEPPVTERCRCNLRLCEPTLRTGQRHRRFWQVSRVKVFGSELSLSSQLWQLPQFDVVRQASHRKQGIHYSTEHKLSIHTSHPSMLNRLREDLQKVIKSILNYYFNKLCIHTHTAYPFGTDTWVCFPLGSCWNYLKMFYK
jgi:hypothetical protein